MSTVGSKLEDKVNQMRRLFDESFASPVQERVTTSEQMLAIRIEGERFALRLSEINGVAVNRDKIFPVPSRFPELLGLTGSRGTVVPVFSLAALLGLTSDRGEPRWVAFCGGKQAPIALAFDEMEHHFEVLASEIYPRETEPARGYVNETVRDTDGFRGVVSIRPLVDYLKARGAGSPRK